MKLLSAKCPKCTGNCLSWVRCRRWYCCEAVDSGGSSWCSVWCGLFIILRNSWSSHFSSSSQKIRLGIAYCGAETHLLAGGGLSH